MRSLKELIFEKALHIGKKSKLGEVKFLETTLKDKHLQDMFDALAKFTGKTKEELELEAEADYELSIKRMTSKVLHETSKKNLAESVVFGLMEKYKFKDEKSPKFNAMIFKKLSMMIEAEHPGMFPLHSVISKKSFEPKYIFVPSDKYPEFNDIKTAAATNDGRFIYNTEFMQRLMDFSFIKGIKPKGKKYVSNGGEIPDVYAQIEFLILHEILHLLQSDSYYQKKYKANSKIINYVGDFRSNYELVKAGYEQLPIGLYSDHVNYDQQGSYKEMYDLVKKALEENKKEQDKNKEKGESDNTEQGEQGEGDDGLDSHDNHTTEHDNEEIDKEHEEDQATKGKDNKPSDTEDGNLTDDEMDAMDKKMKDLKLDQRKEVATSEEARKRREERGKDFDKNSSETDVKLQTVFGVNWKVLLDKLVKKISKADITTSYSKMHKRSITTSTLAISGVPASVRPGEIVGNDEKQKLIFVIDSSGSMMSHIAKVHSEIMHVIAKYNKGMEDEFYVVKFSDTFEVYRCSFKKKNYVKVHIDELSTAKTTPLEVGSKNLLSLFSKSIGGATNLGDTMINHLIKATKNGASVMVFSDSDVLYGENKDALMNLFKYSVRSSIGVVFSDASEYAQFVSIFGNAYGKFVTALS